MVINCNWLPSERNIDLNNLPEETKKAYKIFCNDFVSSTPYFNGMPVKFRKYPIDEKTKRFYAFDHITTRDYEHLQGNSTDLTDRNPDIRRIERISWVRKIIEHPNCKPSEFCNCKGVLTWYEEYKKTYRVNLLLYDEYFMVVLEKRKNSDNYTLITAFYLENDMERKTRYKKYKNSTYNPFNL